MLHTVCPLISSGVRKIVVFWNMMPSSSVLVVTLCQSAKLHYITYQRTMAIISQKLLKDNKKINNWATLWFIQYLSYAYKTCLFPPQSLWLVLSLAFLRWPSLIWLSDILADHWPWFARLRDTRSLVLGQCIFCSELWLVWLHFCLCVLSWIYMARYYIICSNIYVCVTWYQYQMGGHIHVSCTFRCWKLTDFRWNLLLEGMFALVPYRSSVTCILHASVMFQ